MEPAAGVRYECESVAKGTCSSPERVIESSAVARTSPSGPFPCTIPSRMGWPVVMHHSPAVADRVPSPAAHRRALATAYWGAGMRRVGLTGALVVTGLLLTGCSGAVGSGGALTRTITAEPTYSTAGTV